MSDSDDTEILLLIPPDFFIISAEEKLRKEKEHRNQQTLEYISNCYCALSQDILNKSTANVFHDFNYDNWEPLNNSMDSLSVSATAAAAADALSMPPPTAAYKYLPARQKAELNDINTRLATFEQDRFAAPSDISTISDCTHIGSNHKPKRDRTGMTHSTPKSQPLLKEKTYNSILAEAGSVDKGVLHEIDNFLDDRNYGQQWNPASNNENRHSDDYQYCQQLESMSPQVKHGSSLPSVLNHLSLEQKFDKCEEKPKRMQTNPFANGNLISLSDIWGKNGQALAVVTPDITIKEEKLRRQHLERTVHTLQSRLLEYQQRLSVAIEVDRAKDGALASAQTEKKSLNKEFYQMRDLVSKFEVEQLEYNKRQDAMQCELAQAVNLVTKFQEKNEKLEIELGNCRRKITESKKQIEELELKVHGAKTSEELALNEHSKLKDKLAKAEHNLEKIKVRCEDLEKENSTLKHQKELLQEYHQKQKNRADNLETHRKSLQDAVGNLTETESALKKKLELQQKTLKSHYQQQLENVVAQKLKEFQDQLDKMEENLRSEARERERLIAERAIKQLELLNEKNDLELNLVQERNNEEIAIYRMQLANASKKIEELEMKLEAFKSKRADIADKLHNVMETQWQKALEILTSPNNSRTACSSTDAESPECNEHQSKHNDDHRTPKSSKDTNNLNIAETTRPEMDKLHAFIELLLSKSPSDFDKLDEILALSAKSKSASGKQGKTTKGLNTGKPPWKG